MTMFIIQSAILLAIAFLIGCLIGYWLRSTFSDEGKQPMQAMADVDPDSPAAEALREASYEREAVISPEPRQKKPVKPSSQLATVVENPTKKASSPKKKSAAKPKKDSRKKPAAAPSSEKDNLKKIKGVGPQIEKKLNAIGVTTFAQIAQWKASDRTEVGELLSFPGRIEREEWVKQAKQLASGKDTDFSKRVAKGKVESSRS